jgi:hypothetical protein
MLALYVDLDSVVYALDHAVSALRAKGAPPEHWATFVYIGAWVMIYRVRFLMCRSPIQRLPEGIACILRGADSEQAALKRASDAHKNSNRSANPCK